jgi:hypothetical protein
MAILMEGRDQQALMGMSVYLFGVGGGFVNAAKVRPCQL